MLKSIVLVVLWSSRVLSIYPYYDTQDFIYNVPKVFRISITFDKLLDYYERKPSKDPEWYIALVVSRYLLQFTIDELDVSVPSKLKENLTNITRKMDRIREKMDTGSLLYRSKDYRYVAQSILGSIDAFASIMEPITIGTMGTQHPYRIKFEQYVKEAMTGMPTRKSADACMMQLLVTSMETQSKTEAPDDEGKSCEMSPECSHQLMKGSAMGFQMMQRLRALVLAKKFDCMEDADLNAQIYQLCVRVYKETKSLEAWDHPEGTRTLFIQQIFYCSVQGYGEFIKPRWMNKILSWAEPKGCYTDNRLPFEKVTGFVGMTNLDDREREEEYRTKKAAKFTGSRCNSLTSAMALGSLTVYVRALLETDKAFQYDAME